MIVVDGNSLMHRAASGSSLGQSLGGCVYVFLRSLASIARQYRMSYGGLVVVLDSKPRYRLRLYSQYKSNRRQEEALDTSLRSYKEHVHQALGWIENNLPLGLGIPVVKVEGLEGDDLLAYYAYAHYHQVLVAAEDNDINQLVDAADVLQARRGLFYEKGAWPQLGVRGREEWILTKAIAGDSGDNIPGVRGLGPKRAYSYSRALLEGLPLPKGKITDVFLSSLEQLKLYVELVDLTRFVSEPVVARRIKQLTIQACQGAVADWWEARARLKELEVQDVAYIREQLLGQGLTVAEAKHLTDAVPPKWQSVIQVIDRYGG